MTYCLKKKLTTTFIFTVLLSFSFILTLSTPVAAEDAAHEPEELARLKHSYSQRINAERAKYDAMFESAIAPLNQTYIQHLQQMKDRFMRQNDPTSALAVQKEIDKTTIRKTGIYTLVVYNANTYDRGTRRYDITLYTGNNAVWERKNLKLAWKSGKEIKNETKLPDIVFDRIRITITEWERRGGGLAEVQLIQNNINLINKSTIVSASASYGRHSQPESVLEPENYWLLPDNQSGWIDVNFSK